MSGSRLPGCGIKINSRSLTSQVSSNAHNSIARGIEVHHRHPSHVIIHRHLSYKNVAKRLIFKKLDNS